MPIYEYTCTNCHHNFDLLQKISEAPITQCPNCQHDTAQRLVSAAGFQLKGSGWYVTDFKNKDNKNKTAAKSSETPTAPETNTISKKGGAE